MRLILDSGRSVELVHGGGDGTRKPKLKSSSASSLRNNDRVHHRHCPVRSVEVISLINIPFVIRQLFLEHKHLSLEFVPLVQDIPQLLQGEAGFAGLLLLQVVFILHRLLFTWPVLCTKYRISILTRVVWAVWHRWAAGLDLFDYCRVTAKCLLVVFPASKKA